MRTRGTIAGIPRRSLPGRLQGEVASESSRMIPGPQHLSAPTKVLDPFGDTRSSDGLESSDATVNIRIEAVILSRRGSSARWAGRRPKLLFFNGPPVPKLFDVPFVQASRPGKDTGDTQRCRSVDRSLRCDISMSPRRIPVLPQENRVDPGARWSGVCIRCGALPPALTCVVRRCLYCRLCGRGAGRVYAT